MKVYTQLKIEERKIIFDLIQKGASQTIIGEVLNRDRTTIGRELKRNRYDENIAYLPDSAHLMAKERKHKRIPKLDSCDELRNHVIEKLKEQWSPDAIAGSLKVNNAQRKVSTEAIYQYIYSGKGKTLGLSQYLLTRREKRNKKHGRKSRKPTIEEKVSVHNRSEEANQRLEIGHLEADLTFFKGNQSSNIMVIIERTTRYTMLIKNESKKSVTVMKNLFNALSHLPESMRKSVTFDNGTEFTHHQLVRDFLDLDTYFCDPHSPWQKGLVEKTNAMIHRFIPKQSSLFTLDEKSLMGIQNKFNNIPRKVLGYKTPLEVFNSSLHKGALRT